MAFYQGNALPLPRKRPPFHRCIIPNHILPKGVTQTAASAIDGKMVDVKNEKITAIYTIFNA
ncbi:MAG TPA: hypothetical protein VIK39_07965 [Candidatus Angelobacter sp.]